MNANLQGCPLSHRELEIVGHMADGTTAKVIAQKTGLTFNTINMFIKMARRATGAKNSTALVATALRKGWIT